MVQNESSKQRKVMAMSSIPSFDFMGLPLEVRNMIYRHALVRGKIFVPSVISKNLNDVGPDLKLDRDSRGAYIPFKSKDCQSSGRYPRYRDYEEYRYGEPIASGLLNGVSKAVQSEAEAVFYGFGNHFVLPVGFVQHPPLFGNNFRHIPAKIPPFKSISLSFDQRDLKTDPRWWRGISSPRDPSPPLDYLGRNESSFVERMQSIHELQRQGLCLIWAARTSIIKRYVELKFLQIDLEECYCPLGCCRMVDSVLDSIGRRPNYPKYLEESLEQLQIIGLASQKELEHARKTMEDRMRDPNGYNTCSITYTLMDR
ncbi:hypothetical protein G7Y79_00019g046590 [Physcia stellaris]|nr:hypothetical protein G7Y79_00019g046590 [Physcia stellaris]